MRWLMNYCVSMKIYIYIASEWVQFIFLHCFSSALCLLFPRLFPSHFIPPLPCLSLLLLPISCPPGSEGEELHPLQDRGEHQEEGAGVRQGVQAQRRSAAAHRQQQEERGTVQHAGIDMITSRLLSQTKQTNKTCHVSSILPISHCLGESPS